MEFEIDTDLWKIKLKSANELLAKLNKNLPENEKYVYGFGLCNYPIHEIWINKECCKEQQIKTLKHELTHVFIWYSGLYNAPSFTEEMVCDIVSNSYNFVSRVITKFKGEKND